MKRAIVSVVLFCTSGLAHGSAWADLWSRPEQQTIAQREQAYTEIQGEQFAAAAQHLQGFSDPISEYNRGNALAHTGDLQGAITAYDAVLHDGTADATVKQDAQHNRDLVEKQRKSQPQSDKSGKQDGKDQKNSQGGSDGKDAKGDKSSSPDQGAQQKDNNGKDQGNNDQGNKGNPGKALDEPKQDDSNQAAGGQSAEAKQPKDPGESRGEQQGKRAAAQNEKNPAGARPGEASPVPSSEQAQSLDQWLRWIPDDPGGLLRRKFMIEHMLKQRGAQP